MITIQDLINKKIIINNKLNYHLKLKVEDEKEIIILILDYLNGKNLNLSIKTRNEKIAFDISKNYLKQDITLE